ncbi:hypothetical protein BC939DRAFT_471998 [Gamsiella multidivaricata]|uniref:uncharacterized protein n=1 Tax=Gamsiella multidivaricata TaxID=101098 RepID=UPI002220AFB0|nr:uncharacterized protein BC939DRAFT_471998 [Gamsiella multidivaricata]KAI7815733.1 hypothetical protein BC939DRAFT_471998 [Gamsiella multidivaricata]
MTQHGRCSRLPGGGHGEMHFFLCAHSNTLQPTSLLQITFLTSTPLHATLTTMIKAQRNECTFYNCVQRLLDKKEAGLPVRDEDRPVPLTKSEKNHLLRSHSTVPVQREDRSMAFICVCKKPFLTRDSLSKHYKRVCAHSNMPTNVPGLQLIDSAQVLPDDLEVVNASGRVVGATIREFMRGLGIAHTQQQHAQRMQIMAFQEEQRTLSTAVEQRILSSIAQIAAGQGQGQAVQAASASASASDTGPSSPVSTNRKRTRSDAPHFGTFWPPSRMSPTENK